MCHGHETTFFAGGDTLRSGTLTQQFLIGRTHHHQNVSLTRHDGDRLERPEDPERPEAGEVAHLDEGGEVAGGDHGEVQPVPGVPEVNLRSIRGQFEVGSRGRTYVPEVAEVVEDEAPRHRLDDHLGRVDHQKDVPVQRKKEGRKEHKERRRQ